MRIPFRWAVTTTKTKTACALIWTRAARSRAYLDATAREPASHTAYLEMFGGVEALAHLNVTKDADA